MSTPPRPGSHLAVAHDGPEKLRAEIEPLLDVLVTPSSDVAGIERQAEVAERAHRILSDRLAADEVR
ncbi:MAG: hypothetical protein LLG14_17220 [Nocardiaceae bacterium]|nr:hypothetical protein [Nocardiaceae bacterium]